MFRKRVQKGAGAEVSLRRLLGEPDWLESVRLDTQGTARLAIRPVPGDAAASEHRRLQAEAAARSLDGVVDAQAELTADPVTPGATDAVAEPKPEAGRKVTLIASAPASSPPAAGRRRVEKGARLSDEALRQGELPGRQDAAARIPGISRILVVASAKGGVGKSTVAVNLAAAMARAGMKVGLLDADIYGPSIPTMLGTGDARPATDPGGKLVPVRAHGLETLSIGYLSDADAPMIWRGPIVMSAIGQMLRDAAWGDPDDPLDLLVMDTPPGTGDAQLAIAQSVPVTAALLVTTPQAVALADVRRGAAMFAKTHVPVLGIVETMSWFEDPSGQRHPIMGEGGGEEIARALGLPLLAQLPLLTEIRAGGDAGQPAALGDGAAAGLFHALAREVAIGIDRLQTRQPPEIVFED